MQIFAFRDRLRISPKTGQGIKIFFSFIFLNSYTDFVQTNDIRYKWIHIMYWDTLFFVKNYKLITRITFFSMIWLWKLPLCVHRDIWLLHIAKVGYFFLPSLPNMEWSIFGCLPFFFYQKSFIFRFLGNCFWGPNLYNPVG